MTTVSPPQEQRNKTKTANPLNSRQIAPTEPILSFYFPLSRPKIPAEQNRQANKPHRQNAAVSFLNPEHQGVHYGVPIALYPVAFRDLLLVFLCDTLDLVPFKGISPHSTRSPRRFSFLLRSIDPKYFQAGRDGHGIKTHGTIEITIAKSTLSKPNLGERGIHCFLVFGTRSHVTKLCACISNSLTFAAVGKAAHVKHLDRVQAICC
ncbi:hypothetical protein V8F33_000303 [Rhypophila sp. PSN 637]